MSEQGLFRQEAVKNQSARLDGEVLVAQPISASLLILLLLILAASLITFLCLSSFTRKETVQGYLKPDSGLAKIVSPREGIISNIYVDEGQRVKAGDKLALITVPDYLSEGKSVSHSLLQALKMQFDLLDARKKDLKDQFTQQEQELADRLSALDKQLSDTDTQLKLANERLILNKKRLKTYKKLNAKGHISKLEMDKQQELVLGQEQQLAELQATYSLNQSQHSQAEGQLKRLPMEKAQQIAQLDGERSRLEQQQTELQARGTVLITAPISGRVTNLVTDAGNTVTTRDHLMTILPDHSKLYAVLLVPTRAYGFIKAGQSTRIRFDAFPYQRFGLYSGRVAKAGKAVMLPGEVSTPITFREPMYRVDVKLAKQEVNAYGAQMPLKAGMLLSADIVLEKRSLMAWLLEPILSLKGQL